jgi:hypothetical protein
MKQFVECNNIGRTFIAQDVASCAEAIRTVLDSANDFRSHITDDLIKEYSWEAQESKIRQVYKTLLDQPKSASLSARDAAILAQRFDNIEFEALYARHLAQANLKTGLRLNFLLNPTLIERIRFLREKTAEEGVMRTMQFVGSRLMRVAKRR